MRLYEKYRPKTLDDVLGQPCIGALKAFVLEPYPNIIMLSGPSGTGKTAAAMAMSDALAWDGPLGSSAYDEIGSRLKVERVAHYFDRETTPFRYKLPDGKFHVLRIDELERLNVTVKNDLKEALERAQREYRVVIIATSNDPTGLEKALLHRFKHYIFSAGPGFAEAINDWLPKVWGGDVGDAEMPYQWQQFGWDGEEFSARLALDKLEMYIALERREAAEKVGV